MNYHGIGRVYHSIRGVISIVFVSLTLASCGDGDAINDKQNLAPAAPATSNETVSLEEVDLLSLETPLKRIRAGSSFNGAYSVLDHSACEPQASAIILPPILPRDHRFYANNIPIGTLLDGRLSDLNRAYKTMAEFDDPLMSQTHICVGYFDDEHPGGNALSYVFGYIVFDAALFNRMNMLPDEKRGMYLFDMITYHLTNQLSL